MLNAVRQTPYRKNGQGIAGLQRIFLHSVCRLLTRCVLFLANDSRERHSAVTALVRRLCSLLRPFATSAVQCDSESHRCSSQFPRSCIPCIFNSTAVTCHPLVHPAGPRSEPRRAVGRSGGVEGFRATLADWTGKHLCPQNESRDVMVSNISFVARLGTSRKRKLGRK